MHMRLLREAFSFLLKKCRGLAVQEERDSCQKQGQSSGENLSRYIQMRVAAA